MQKVQAAMMVLCQLLTRANDYFKGFKWSYPFIISDAAQLNFWKIFSEKILYQAFACKINIEVPPFHMILHKQLFISTESHSIALVNFI